MEKKEDATKMQRRRNEDATMTQRKRKTSDFRNKDSQYIYCQGKISAGK